MPEVPPPGNEFETEKFRVPVEAPAWIVMFAVIWVELSTVVEFTVMLDPTFTELVPEMKLVPVKTTLSV